MRVCFFSFTLLSPIRLSLIFSYLFDLAIPSSLSISSRSTSSHCISTVAPYSDHNNYHSLVREDSFDECAHSSSDLRSDRATKSERKSDVSPSSSPPMTSEEEEEGEEESEDNLSFSRTLFTSAHAQRRRHRRRTRTGKASNLSFISTLTLPNNLTLQSDFFSLAERQNNHIKPPTTTTTKKKKLSIGRQTSIITGRGTSQCEQRVRSFSSRRAS